MCMIGAAFRKIGYRNVIYLLAVVCNQGGQRLLKAERNK